MSIEQLKNEVLDRVAQLGLSSLQTTGLNNLTRTVARLNPGSEGRAREQRCILEGLKQFLDARAGRMTESEVVALEKIFWGCAYLIDSLP